MTFSSAEIFEVHLSVSDRQRSAAFYQRVLGFQIASEFPARDCTFLWMGPPGSRMLGLWGPACPNPPISRGIGHFAMRLPHGEVVKSLAHLRELGVSPLDFDGKPTDEPVVIAWMPAVSVYFADPDGHSLEFISMLDEQPQPGLGILKLSDWNKRK
ncbi:MAG: VOC family protein [Bdellovibrionota bacterium]|nr:MAG: VOC family protein [Bdellovibrionota bacterium]